MNQFFLRFFILIALSNTTVSNAILSAEEPKLSWNKATTEMRHFRTFEEIHQKTHISTAGYTKNLSGSGQLTEPQFATLVSKLIEVSHEEYDKIICVDLRLESHGFINGLPVEWKTKANDYNLNKTTEEIIADEKSRLLNVVESDPYKLQNTPTEESPLLAGIGVQVYSVATEEEAAAAHGLEYVRLATLDHYRPSDTVVEDFVTLMKNHPNSWLHVHCHVGKGRTTTFMAMYDMFYNAKDLEFEEILKRQKAIDGEDLMKHDTQNSRARFEFLINFYDYCKNSDPTIISWQEWLQKNLENNSL